MPQQPPKIDLLPEHLIDQIKAGEIIERPGNLLKEILENSVDAGSTKIELTLKNNGLDFISLKDNGHGMGFADLPLAFSRHATSKISRFEDLYQLHSFGFRGEALASIAAISKLQCITYTKNEPEGSEIRIEGGQTLSHSKRMSPREPGTELIIQDLFFNTPVRLKFIQSQNSEKQFIRRVVYSFIFSHPEIEFHLKFDEEEKQIFQRVETLEERIKEAIPKIPDDKILHIKKSYEENEFEIFLMPSQYKGPLKFQFIFINNRYVTDKQLSRIISNALISTFGHDDFNTLCFFKLPAGHIDVNVHPSKTIIKIFEHSKAIAPATSSIKELRSTPQPQIAETASSFQEATPSTAIEQNFFGHLDISQELLQKRQEYNMEGIFSPHQLHLKTPEQENLIWFNDFFIKKFENINLAFSAHKLIQAYVEKMLESPSSSLPLLVSEPFEKNGVHIPSLEKFARAGAELDLLNGTTYVLRAIPEWLNGFPLKEVVRSIIYNRSFNNITINPLDWSSSTWDEMINKFSVTELIEQKVALNLDALLKEKLW
ncbi:MAG TPA: DNA mismatch repair endonuclease MutL [Bacteriovoracaceae bacterium]|nr:DNA mismatch repair endonuclease MutL [Bacteriovoracaceae bacterium]